MLAGWQALGRARHSLVGARWIIPLTARLMTMGGGGVEEANKSNHRGRDDTVACDVARQMRPKKEA